MGWRHRRVETDREETDRDGDRDGGMERHREMEGWRDGGGEDEYRQTEKRQIEKRQRLRDGDGEETLVHVSV